MNEETKQAIVVCASIVLIVACVTTCEMNSDRLAVGYPKDPKIVACEKQTTYSFVECIQKLKDYQPTLVLPRDTDTSQNGTSEPSRR